MTNTDIVTNILEVKTYSFYLKKKLKNSQDLRIFDTIQINIIDLRKTGKKQNIKI